jgi:ubiquinone/menaquinone biosynthesis C-methylase UbiE
MTEPSLSNQERQAANEVRRRSYAKEAPKYEKSMGFFERHVFGTGHRQWACSQAKGETLEVAVGTGLNLAHYPTDVNLTGIDLSPEMLAVASKKIPQLDRQVHLKEGDAHDLAFEDATFDTVVCTYSLCNIPDPRKAVAEMNRVLRPGGTLILVDHIRSPNKAIFWFQKLVEFFTRRLEGEHMTRRSLEHVKAEGFEITDRERMRAGIVERIVAVKPS